MGLVNVLTVLFVALKLTGYIDWSWWYVTMPTWGAYSICALGYVALNTYKEYRRL